MYGGDLGQEGHLVPPGISGFLIHSWRRTEDVCNMHELGITLNLPSSFGAGGGYAGD